MSDEIKLHFSKHETAQINGSNVRCYPETFDKELTNAAKFGYTKALITINNNQYQLKRFPTSQQWLPDEMYKDLKTIKSTSTKATTAI